MPAWLVFLLSGAAIVLAGVRLSRDGDTIAVRTGLGGAWVGAILVATYALGLYLTYQAAR